MSHVLSLTSGNSSEIRSIVDSHLKIDLSDVVTEHFIRIQSAEVAALKAKVKLGQEGGLGFLVGTIQPQGDKVVVEVLTAQASSSAILAVIL